MKISEVTDGRDKTLRIYINQLGYLPKSIKTAVLAGEPGTMTASAPPGISIFKEDGRCVLEKTAWETGMDETSGDQIWQADFSELEEEGSYQICSYEGTVSCHFRIQAGLYGELVSSLCKAFYFQRCGIKLEERYAGIFKRESCHEEKALLLEDYLGMGKKEDSLRWFDVSGGWHDAGDYGRYTTPAASALAHLLYAWRWFPESFKGKLNIPESGYAMDDILGECLYELRWLLKMQMKDKSVCHKLTSMRHANFVMPSKDKRQLVLFPPSTMATGAFAAIMALASRIYKDMEPEFAKEAFKAAKGAWEWLEEHPETVGFCNPSECNTGEYGDEEDRDERLWAAAELYCCTSEERYLQKAYDLYEGLCATERTGLGWRNTAGLAGFALLEQEIRCAGEARKSCCILEEQAWREKQTLEAELKRRYMNLFEQEAHRILALSGRCGYMAAMGMGDFHWGSNMTVMMRGMVLTVAYLLSAEKEFFDCAVKQMDYLLGVNALGFSYVTGMGEHSVKNIHNRVTVADGIRECIPGVVSGGANSHPSDEKAEWLIEEGTPPMKCFVDEWECYSLNENAIYWNSPVVFVAAFLDAFVKV